MTLYAIHHCGYKWSKTDYVSIGCWYIYSFAPVFSEEYMDAKDIYSNWKWHINIVRSGAIFFKCTWNVLLFLL